MSKEEYETLSPFYKRSLIRSENGLKQMEEMLEHLDIAEDMRKRLKGHKRSENISWDKIKKKYALNI